MNGMSILTHLTTEIKQTSLVWIMVLKITYYFNIIENHLKFLLQIYCDLLKGLLIGILSIKCRL